MKVIVQLSLAVLCLFVLTESKAQWTPSSETFDGGMVTAIKSFGTRLFAGTANFPPKHNKIYESSDSGLTWVLKDSINGYNDAIIQFAVMGDTLFAADADSGIYRSADDGNTWDQFYYLPNVHHYPVCVKDSVIIVGTDNGELHLSTDTGLTWNINDSSSLCNYINCLANSSTHIFAGTCNGTLASADNGNSWLLSGTAIPNPDIAAVKCKGSFVFVTNGSRVFRSPDNGATWVDVSNNLYLSSFKRSFGVSNNNLLCATQYGIHVTADDGQNWIAANTGLGNVQVNAFDTLGNYIFAATNNGVYRIDTSQITLLPCDNIITLATSTNPSCSTCTDGTATIFPMSGTPPYTYSWATTPVQTTQTATGLSNGYYLYCVTDSAGCTGCDSVLVDNTLGINSDLELFSFSIFPNPASEKITIALPKNTPNAVITIYNKLGQSVYSSMAINKVTEADISNLVNGMYIIQIATDSSHARIKFIKQ